MSEFGSLNIEEMQGEDNRLNEAGGANNFLDQFVPMPEVKPGQTGTVAIRILPPTKSGKIFQFNRVHTLNNRKIHCPRNLSNGKWDRNTPCPICDYYSSLWAQVDKLEKAGHGSQAETLKDEARSLKPVERYYYNAIVRTLVDSDGKTLNNVGPRILSVGKILHKMIIRAIVGDENDPDSKLGNITDLKNGYDFIIRKEVTAGQDNFPKYDRSGFARQTSPAGEPTEIEKWATNLHDLTKLRNPKELESLEKELAIHRGLIADDVEAFSTDDFDAKWKSKAQDEVSEYMEHTPGGVRVTENVVSSTPAVKATVAENSATPSTPVVENQVAEAFPEEDEDFLKTLEEMEG